MKTEKILCIGHQGVFMKEPLPDQVATLLVLAKLSRMGIRTKRYHVRIFMLSGEIQLSEGILHLIRKTEKAMIIPSGDYGLYIICDGKTMIDLLSVFSEMEWSASPVTAADFLRFLQNRKQGSSVQPVQLFENEMLNSDNTANVKS